jgi:hypothetical protein
MYGIVVLISLPFREVLSTDDARCAQAYLLGVVEFPTSSPIESHFSSGFTPYGLLPIVHWCEAKIKQKTRTGEIAALGLTSLAVTKNSSVTA